jgi:hypothetical protein
MSVNVIISNAFSLNMLDLEVKHSVCITPVDPREWLAENADHFGITVQSAVGHADTAAIFSAQLGREIAPNRVSVRLGLNTILLVGQYKGPRLPEGVTTLPEGASIEWVTVGLRPT